MVPEPRRDAAEPQPEQDLEADVATPPGQLRHDGGKVRLRYSLDLNANALSVNELDITIKEARPHA